MLIYQMCGSQAMWSWICWSSNWISTNRKDPGDAGSEHETVVKLSASYTLQGDRMFWGNCVWYTIAKSSRSSGTAFAKNIPVHPPENTTQWHMCSWCLSVCMLLAPKIFMVGWCPQVGHEAYVTGREPKRKQIPREQEAVSNSLVGNYLSGQLSSPPSKAFGIDRLPKLGDRDVDLRELYFLVSEVFIVRRSKYGWHLISFW